MKAISVLITSLLFSTLFVTVQAGTWTSSEYRDLSGIIKYKVYVPANLSKKSKSPVVVMLHGCQQNATDFATGTRIEKWADKNKFIALFPEQSITKNPFKCWNWIIPMNNSRMGEAKSIVAILDIVLKDYNADQEKVFAAGMSAGGSMVNILGNCFPDRFKALASHDGTQFYSSYLGLDFAEVVLSGANVPSNVSAMYGNLCSSMIENRPTSMPILILHGMKSPLMSPMHAFQVEAEFKAYNDFLDNGIRDNSYFQEKDVITVPATDVYGYNLYTTTNTDHVVFIERYMIDNLAHGWSGGVKDMPYNDPKGPDASALIFNFFKRFGL